MNSTIPTMSLTLQQVNHYEERWGWCKSGGRGQKGHLCWGQAEGVDETSYTSKPELSSFLPLESSPE